MKFGELRRDDSDEDDANYPQFADRTPNTKRRLVNDDKKKNVKKLGTFATGFTVFKGFVGTGILYLPKSIYNGGWLFSSVSLIMFCLFTLYCTKLLLEVHDKMGGSFSSIGTRLYGKWGKICVDVTLIGSQFGFVCGYIYFIAVNLDAILYQQGVHYSDVPGKALNKWWYALICFVIIMPLVMVRSIEKFAITHLFANVMICITLTITCYFAY